ncbi:MAG: lycopene cyclase domain-containing protein [Flavobacteriales bacterium]|nr:lycopene cyclase domain-containing protein [Flavobacteriales bacterium]
MDSHFLYLAVNLGSLAVPLLLSFDKRVAFYKSWKYFWPANLITLIFFIVWDVLFANAGIWGFNNDYLMGPRILGLPVEEWLFFICIPYACVFLYETFKAWIPGEPFKKWGKPAVYGMAALCILLMATNVGKHYTFFTTLFTFIGLLVMIRWRPQWLGWFAFTYLIILIPFLLANGILTGLDFWQYPILNSTPEIVSDQIVWYNNDHNLGFRIFSVPIDDTVYGFLLIGMNISLFEGLRSKA